MTELVTRADAIAAIVDNVRGARLVAFDLEFLSADRLVPVLCLIQVGWVAGEHTGSDAQAVPAVALVDPLGADVAAVRALVEALAAHECCVVHGGRQDLGILATRFGVAMPRVFDTQIMAAFAGLGDQIGFAALAKELLGIDIDKGPQWTDWARRPLQDKQVAYAIGDVLHLPAMYALLADRLGADRLAWTRAESGEMAAAAMAAAAVTPETAWQDVGGVRGLDSDAMAAVVALAAWRLRVCRELDKPLGQVINDRTLVDLAKAQPTDAGEVRAVKGLSPLARTRADEIVRAIAPEVAATPEGDWEPQETVRIPLVTVVPSPPPRYVPPSPRAQRWAELLLLVAQLVAAEHNLAVRLLATRADAEDFARTADEHGLTSAALAAHPALATWRAAPLGATWLGFLSGTLALVGDAASPLGVRLAATAG